MPTIENYAHGQFCWVDLVAHDMESAKAFYHEMFGWTSTDVSGEGGPPYSQFLMGDQVIAGCGQMSDEMKSQGIPQMWNSYINVEDADATLAKVTEAGGTVTVPVMQVMEFGRLAFFMDPQGANVGIWEKGSHRGATLVNDSGAFCWNELATRDMEAACEFYGQVFGWTYEDNEHSPGPYKIIKCSSGDNGGIMQMTEEWGPEIPPNWTVYFTVDDVPAATERLAGLGGQVCFGPFETPVGPMAIVSDAQGGMFNVISMNEV